MSTNHDRFQISLVPDRGETPHRGSAGKRRDRREAYRVPLGRPARADWTPACQLKDISATGVGFLAPRRDASLLDDAFVLVHVADTTSFRAVVQRVDLGGSSEEWVQVGARFAGLDEEERASLCALVTASCH